MRIMQKKISYLLPALTVFLLTGCICYSRSRTPEIFDLEPQKIRQTALPFQVEFSLFRNLSGADRRLLTRDGNQMKYDADSRWIQDPELLLERFLRTSLCGSGKSVVRVRGVITAFEIDLQKKTAELSVDFTLRSGERSIAFSCSAQEQVDGKKPEEAVKALSEMLEKEIF